MVTQPGKPAPDTTRRSERSRRAIHDAALALVAEVGYPRTTIEGIAARAGVGKQTIYRWWGSKADVLLEACLGRGEPDGGAAGRGPDALPGTVTGKVRQVGQQPPQARLGIGQRQDSEPQRVPAQGTADGQHSRTELLFDIVHHPGVGRGGGGQDRNGIRQPGDEVRDAAVVGTEVVAPVRDAVGFIDDQQPGAAEEFGQLGLPESGIGEPFRRDQEDIHLIGGQLFADGVPLQLVGGVDGDGADPGTGGSGHLVPHQGEQGRNDQRGPGSPAPQQQGCHEGHG